MVLSIATGSLASTTLKVLDLSYSRDIMTHSGFMTGLLQTHARKYDLPIDHLSFKFTVKPEYRDQATYQDNLEKGGDDPDALLDVPKDGALVYGVYTDAWKWDDASMCMTESDYGVMNTSLPIFHMLPEMDFVPSKDDYICPLYKEGLRAGTLSTTGNQHYSITQRLTVYI